MLVMRILLLRELLLLQKHMEENLSTKETGFYHLKTMHHLLTAHQDQ